MPLGKIVAPALATADVCDALGKKVAVLPVDFQDFGGVSDFAGPAVTLQTLDDNTKVRALLETEGEGRVLIVDGGASDRAALVGGNLAALAAGNGWAGLVVYGRVRDRHELSVEDVGIKALGSCPRKSEKLGRGDVNVEIAIGGVTIHPGDWIIADADGVVVSKELPSL
ncbi:ribonuclease E activity regulator RraA [Kordiimonas marina]|uniref:ribonuclease E activity regulator RraA n=1 Tax=Kordiimonas marina TaxID=2872312 RepID=UPI001FF5737E|nr:ribonuclease E activity regulator RraA [Kordiimonas marina]MCJ9428397.1 ribonuclease E activity regulator RraA [Kordiimonas marina]